ATSRQPLHGFIDRVLTEERSCTLPQLAVVQTREGLDRAIDASASPLRTEAGRTVGAIVVFRDISALQQQAQQLWHQAHHDALTGLVNRRGFVNRLQTTLDATVRAEDRHVLCYLDLDGFKRVNDTCGHAAGDELLRQISQLVQQRVRATDTLARLGGDEFCVLLYGCSLARASQIAEGWRAAIAAVRFAWAGQTFEIGASIGLFEIDASTPSTDGALKAADKACYRAKRDGRNCVRAYCPTDNRGSERRGDRAWIQRLERALAEDEFVLFGQAMLPLNDDRRQRSEVLLRLQADSGDYCMPMAFIPAAERYGLMPRIDFKIIQTAIACLQESEPTPELLGSDTLAPKTATPNSGRVFSINLSGASLSDRSFWQALADELDRHSGVGASLCFEISEMVAIANLSAAMDFITTFKRFGCEFALDRFSGMSSFSCLQQLAVDFLKLDGSAIAPSTSHPLDRAMLSSSIHISRAMGLQTVVLRAEHAEAIANVKALGADYVQGYGVAHPVLLTDRLGAASQFPRLSA
ncbi:MAG: EAL domain-containing protein, partial [Cyanobacteria bacterium J06648_11]